MKTLRIMAVGRLRMDFLKEATEYYKKKLACWYNVVETVIKDGDSKFPIIKRKAVEGKRIVDALGPTDIPICLDEKGIHMTSRSFSEFLCTVSENMQYKPCFIIGGAFGLDKVVLNRAKFMLSLGKMTFPHELARVFLFEQLYRAESLVRKIGYHHD